MKCESKEHQVQTAELFQFKSRTEIIAFELKWTLFGHLEHCKTKKKFLDKYYRPTSLKPLNRTVMVAL